MRENADIVPERSQSHLAWIDAARAEADAARRRRASHETRVSRPRARSSFTGLLAQALNGYEFGPEISRGGQGIVYRCVQRGTRRTVAIKVMHQGPLASDEGRARFEREARILGQLRHPNIVAVLDSGTAGGCFYFVMDYIDGLALDDHVRINGLSVRQTLELFATICDAVHVAHVRGIIHRDIKPSNIRVDRQGGPHVMDFGLAKVEEPDDGDAVHTLTGQFVGSVPWASPEQVEGRPERIDVRTDVYSLGVVLFQLVTGTFPYPVDGNLRAALDNVCNADPLRPGSLNRALDDELDQIILKCLRKEPDQRYQTAGDLARELRRYLAGEPIEAKRSSTWYVFRKAVRRNKARVALLATVFSSVIIASIALAVLYHRETVLRAEAVAARDEAGRQARIAQAVVDFLDDDILSAARPDALGRDVSVRQALNAAAAKVDERFDGEPAVQAGVHFSLGNTYFMLGEYDSAERHLAAARRLYEQTFGENANNTLSALNDLGRLYEATGRLDEAERLLRMCWKRRQSAFGPRHEETLRTLTNLGWLTCRMGRLEEAEQLCREAFEQARARFGDEHPDTLVAMSNLATVYSELGRTDEALRLYERDVEISRRINGPEHPDTLISLANLATLLMGQGELERARGLYEQVLEARQRVLGPDHPSTILVMNNLAVLYSRVDRLDLTGEMLRQALHVARAAQGDDHPTVITMTSNLGWVYNRLERFEEAEPLHAAAVAGARGYLPPDHPYLGLYLTRLGVCQLGLARFHEAEETLLTAYEILAPPRTAEGLDARATTRASPPRAASSRDNSEAQDVIATLVSLYEQTGRTDEAAHWRRKLDED